MAEIARADVVSMGKQQGLGCVGHDNGHIVSTLLGRLSYPYPIWKEVKDLALELLVDNAHEGEDISRQVSPWELECKELNELKDFADFDVWDAYNEGIALAISEEAEEELPNIAHEYESQIGEIQTVWSLLEVRGVTYYFGELEGVTGLRVLPFCSVAATYYKHCKTLAVSYMFGDSLAVFYKVTELNGELVLKITYNKDTLNAMFPRGNSLSKDSIEEITQEYAGKLLSYLKQEIGDLRSINVGEETHTGRYFPDAGDTLTDPHWIHVNEHGMAEIICAETFEAAFDELLDNSAAISDEDVEDAQDPDDGLTEGHYFMPNAGGTNGIVWLGHNWTLKAVH